MKVSLSAPPRDEGSRKGRSTKGLSRPRPQCPSGGRRLPGNKKKRLDPFYIRGVGRRGVGVDVRIPV